ncbi:MAG: redoxin domain-containing protein [Bacteroidetes bacterium]|nr:redoxin domain-containing protein [Bacteroidota bacterium]MBK9672897.1 redoxin domain-containing protein [Bacteroidota bacterium]MBK9801006.1 redoxin domain-containing protein [Bacteroidota bacterium]MBP6413991.1 redoxin domain-containing protein [Bacteroidia bacterium]
MQLNIGDKAPEFTLYSSEKKEIRLQNLQGKNVVLLFFPFAFTGTCTKELCSVRDEISDYNNLDAEVIGISVDSIFSLAKYKEEQGLNFTLLSDFNKETSKAYGSLYSTFGLGNMIGVSKRSAFVIDSKGIIQYAEVLENASEIPNLAAVKKVLADLNE